MTQLHESSTAGLVVEIGCGASPPKSRGVGTSPLGVDIDFEALRQASDLSSGREFVCADAQQLPLAHSSCQSLTLRAVLHHLVPVISALKELARALRPRGVLTIVDGVALAAAEVESLEQELRAAGLPSEPKYGFGLDEITALVQAAGLDVADLVCEGTATFASPPFVSRPYASDRFTLIAHRS